MVMFSKADLTQCEKNQPRERKSSSDEYAKASSAHRHFTSEGSRRSRTRPYHTAREGDATGRTVTKANLDLALMYEVEQSLFRIFRSDQGVVKSGLQSSCCVLSRWREYRECDQHAGMSCCAVLMRLFPLRSLGSIQ